MPDIGKKKFGYDESGIQKARAAAAAELMKHETEMFDKATYIYPEDPLLPKGTAGKPTGQGYGAARKGPDVHGPENNVIVDANYPQGESFAIDKSTAYKREGK